MGKKIAFLLAVLAAVVAAYPHWYGAWKTPPGYSFLWSGYPWDTNQYYSFMRTGYRGDWLLTNLLTDEPHPPVLLMPFFVFLGHVAAWYRDFLTWREGEPPLVIRTIPVVYHNSRVILTFALTLLVYWLATLLRMRRVRRLWVVAFALFSSGILWGQKVTPEAGILNSCIQFPNFSLSLCLYLGACGAFLMVLETSRKITVARASCPCAHGQDAHAAVSSPTARGVKKASRAGRSELLCPALIAAISGCGLGFTHPFDLPPLGGLASVLILLWWIQSRRFPSRLFLVAAVFSGSAGLPVLYQLSITWRIPEFAQINSGNRMLWDHWWSGIGMLELLLAPALIALPFLFRQRHRPEALFVLVWVIVAVIAMHLPLSFQRRMVEGVPLALVFAIPAMIEGVFVRPLLCLRNRRGAVLSRRRVRLVRHGCYLLVFLILLPKTLWILYDRSINVFSNPKGLSYVPEPESEALDWLSKHSDWRGVVWASYWRGNRLPLLSGNRVFFGHDVMTVLAPEKERITAALYSFDLPIKNFRSIVKKHHVQYILWTEVDRFSDKRRRDFWEYDPETLSKPVYANDFAKIYKLHLPNAPSEK